MNDDACVRTTWGRLMDWALVLGFLVRGNMNRVLTLVFISIGLHRVVSNLTLPRGQQSFGCLALEFGVRHSGPLPTPPFLFDFLSETIVAFEFLGPISFSLLLASYACNVTCVSFRSCNLSSLHGPPFTLHHPPS